MNPRIFRLAICCAALMALHGTALAQERIYRCGNEYTNDAAVARQRNCQVVDGGHVTIVHSDRNPSRPARAEGKAGSPNRSLHIDRNQQKARDSDARAILEAELAKAQQKLEELRNEYNDGNPVKSALELRNPQVFQERLQALKDSIARQEADVASIQRELARHAGS